MSEAPEIKSEPAEVPKAADSRFVMECLAANELGDGLLFAKVNEGQYLYNCSADEWMVWAGHHWSRDITNKVHAAVEAVAMRYLDEIPGIEAQLKPLWDEHDEILGDEGLSKEQKTAEIERVKREIRPLEALKKKLESRANKLRSARGGQNCLIFAQSPTANMSIRGDELDQKPWLLACKNGVVDLRNGKFTPGQQTDYILLASSVEWKGIEEPCSLWEQSLKEIFDWEFKDEDTGETYPGASAAIVDYLHRLFGYSATGLTKMKVFPVLVGSGWNGKTFIVETISDVLGPLAAPISSEMLLDQGRARGSTGPSPDIMSLRGLRAAFASETDEGRKISASRLKWLTGSDTLVGRNPHDKYQTTFKPTHTLIMLTNHPPHPPQDDFAFRQRLHMVTFPLSFVSDPKKTNERKKIDDLPERIKSEHSGILAWLVRGCLEWITRGLDPPGVIAMQTAKFLRDENYIEDFLEQCTETCVTGRESADELYKVFKAWFAENVSKKYSVSQRSFGDMMARRFEKKKSGAIFYLGIKLMKSLEDFREDHSN